VSDLADAVLPLIRTRADLHRWSAANAHGVQMHQAVDLLRDAAGSGDPAVVFSVTQWAITSALKVIMRADDSSGIIGDACQGLLDLHAQAAVLARPAAATDWAKQATDFDRGHQARKAADFWCRLLAEQRPGELLPARVDVFRRWHTSDTATRLYEDSGAGGPSTGTTSWPGSPPARATRCCSPCSACVTCHWPGTWPTPSISATIRRRATWPRHTRRSTRSPSCRS
jgi:hypothetical protein